MTTLLPLLFAPERATRAQGTAALLACGAAWAALCVGLDLAGHAPTRAPIPHWYRLQAALVVPWLLLMGAVYVGIAGALARRLGARGDLAGPLRASLGLPLLVGFVLPDALVWAFAGFDALWPAMAYYGAATVLWSLSGGVRAARRVGGLSLGRAVAVVLPAWLAQALVATLVLK